MSSPPTVKEIAPPSRPVAVKPLVITEEQRRAIERIARRFRDRLLEKRPC